MSTWTMYINQVDGDHATEIKRIEDPQYIPRVGDKIFSVADSGDAEEAFEAATTVLGVSYNFAQNQIFVTTQL